jgi:hypothetical protein
LIQGLIKFPFVCVYCILLYMYFDFSGNALTNFWNYLPDDRKPIDEETMRIIERYHGNWMRGIFSTEGAVSLLEAAANHVHQSTKIRIQSLWGLLLDVSFEQGDSNCADLVRAFDIHTLSPKVIKFSSTVNIDNQIFLHLGLTPEQATSNYIVPVSLIIDEGGKQGLVMPAYASSLSVVRRNTMPDSARDLEPAILRGILQIRQALEVLHSKGVVHNDIKPGNILLDFNGNWHLCDFGSCTQRDVRSAQLIEYTAYYQPSDFHNLGKKVTRNSIDYDLLLLAVVARDLLTLLRLDSGFTSYQLIESVNRVYTEELRNLLITLTRCLR